VRCRKYTLRVKDFSPGGIADHVEPLCPWRRAAVMIRELPHACLVGEFFAVLLQAI
jgi:hypothetical protein